MNDSTESEVPLRELSRPQRRVLGVLLEKAFTTPDVYPLTIKSTVSGCNQKSNRDPIVDYDEDRVERVLDELRELGLVGIVHTESGRSARFRHYMRHKFSFTEEQLAILTELMLRGRQSLGDLRVRASRMVPIDSLELLRSELLGLMEKGYVQADGALERRGVEVDHMLYPSTENHQAMVPRGEDEPAGDGDEKQVFASGTAKRGESSPMHVLVEQIQQLQAQNQQLSERVQAVEEKLSELQKALGN